MRSVIKLHHIFLCLYCILIVVPSVHTILTVPFSYWFIANVITSYSCGIIADGFEAGGTGLAWYGNPANPAGGLGSSTF